MSVLQSAATHIRSALSGGRRQGVLTQTGAKVIRTDTHVYSPWNGDVYSDDITRAVIWSFAEIASKAQFIHARGYGNDLKINPDADIRLLLEQPNEYLTMQDITAKLAIDYERYNNAFAYIVRAPNGRPVMLYPLHYQSVRLEEDAQRRLYCRFSLRGARDLVAPYSDIIHLRKHFADDEFFGNDNKAALSGIMEVVTTSDQGIVAAIKNSAVINWILHFKQVLQPADVNDTIKRFSDSYLSAENNKTTVVPDDPRFDAEQIKHESYVPNAAQTDKAKARIYAYYGSSEAIVTGTYTEDQYNAYYEKRVEPFLHSLCTQMTLKFFSVIDRTHMNRILVQPSSLGFSNNATRLNFVQMVDRGAMTPDEWREMFNMPPILGGDKPIRRLDTASVSDGKSQPVAKIEDDDTKPKEGEQPMKDEKPKESQDTRSTQGKPEEARHDWIFEMRAADEGEGQNYIVEGDAVVFDQPTLMYETPDGLKYYEVICAGALDGADMSDVPMRYNHSQNFMIVGRHNERRPNRSTVDFALDRTRLHIRADLSKTESARQLYEAIKAGLIDKMSFAFTVSEESYDQETRTRKVIKIKKLWDVSAVDTPQYDTTSIYARNRFAAEAETEKRNADAADAQKRAVIADLEILLTLNDQNERSI